MGVNYFAGWWEPLPNKWHDPVDGSDWRPKYPGRVPLLGDTTTQETVDREIEAAAAHGVDFFSILWYWIPPGAEPEKNVRLVNAGLECFLKSPRAARLSFCIEFCNHPPFRVTSDEAWEQCLRAWMPAFRHPSHLRAGGRPVFKIPSAVEPQPKVPLRKPGIQERKPGSLLGSSWLPGFLRDSSRGSKDLKISSTARTTSPWTTATTRRGSGGSSTACARP